MHLDFACGYRRRKSAWERDIDERWHEAIYSGSLQTYLRANSTYFQLSAPRRSLAKPRRHCERCGTLVLHPRQKYCENCIDGVRIENNRRYKARLAQERLEVRRAKRRAQHGK